MFIDFRERGKKGDRQRHPCDRETLMGCLPYVPQLGIEPTTFWCTRRLSNRVQGSCCLSAQPKSRNSDGIVVVLLLMSCQQSEKEAGKNPNIHLPLSFQKKVYLGETVKLGG